MLAAVPWTPTNADKDKVEFRVKIVEADAVLGDMVDQDTEILTIMNPNSLRVDTEI